MTPHVIVSYDDTANDQDALALARRLADAGAGIALAYVRHDLNPERAKGNLQEDAARALLDRGAATLGAADARRHVILDASTADGLRTLAEREHADVVVFGSDYRTAIGAVKPQRSAEQLLAGGPAAIAIAPAGLRDRDWQIKRIGVLAEAGDTAAQDTARSLAAALGATVAEPGTGPVDLMIVGSRAEAAPGRVLLSATAEYAIETASSPVLVVRRGAPVTFGALVAH
jgi:nucleotide-binding universal stress UspA family protein